MHKFEPFFKGLNRPSVISNNTFQIVACNRLYEEAFGVPSNGKKHLVDFVAPEDRKRFLKTYPEWISTGKDRTLTVECIMCLKPGTQITCELSIQQITDVPNEMTVFLVVISQSQKMNFPDQGDFLDQMREIYFKVGLDGHIYEMTPVFFETMGFEPMEGIIGGNLFNFVSLADDSLKETEVWETLITHDGQVKDYEIALPKSDGTEVLFECNVGFFYNDQLNIVGIEGFAVDVTSNRTLIEELKSTLNFTSSLLQALPTPVMYKNKKLTFLGCNNAFSKLTGISEQELKGQSAGDIWQSEFATIIEQKDKETIETGRSQVFEGYINNASGDRIAVIMITACYPGPKGKPAGVIAAFLDITARKTVELAIKRNEEAIYKENRSLRRIINPHLRKTVMVGASPAVMALYDQIHQAAKTNMPVLIEGESGTGKELVAKEIHRNSDRADRDVVAVNCSAIPKELTESMFFGHTKGAFTGALSSSDGYIQEANGSTLFLDEINSIPLEMQAKLLRVLESGEVTPVGGSAPVESNFRLISASNQDLEALVEKGGMRADFYYRLKVLSIKVPPLRERKEDIPMLAYHFLNQYKQEHSGAYSADKKFITKELFLKLKEHDFPGNIRELRNVLFQCFLTGNLVLNPPPKKETTVQNPKTDSGHQIDIEVPQNGSLKEIVNDFERKVILQLLKTYRFNRTQVAKHLKIGRKTLYNKMKTLGIDYDD